jgi:hypothetical protein
VCWKSEGSEIIGLSIDRSFSLFSELKSINKYLKMFNALFPPPTPNADFPFFEDFFFSPAPPSTKKLLVSMVSVVTMPGCTLVDGAIVEDEDEEEEEKRTGAIGRSCCWEDIGPTE